MVSWNLVSLESSEPGQLPCNPELPGMDTVDTQYGAHAHPLFEGKKKGKRTRLLRSSLDFRNAMNYCQVVLASLHSNG
jgi:hypothetical protein